MGFEREDGERTLANEPADLFVGPRKVDGRLYVTDRRIVFESRRLDSWRDSVEIALEDIVDAYPWDTTWGPVGLVVRTHDRDCHRLLSKKRDRLIDLIQVCRAGALWAHPDSARADGPRTPLRFAVRARRPGDDAHGVSPRCERTPHPGPPVTGPAC